MTESIIVAIVALIGTLLGSFGGAQLTKYRIQQLEKKVDEHNKATEKIPVMCERIDRLEEDVKDIKRALPIKIKEGR